MDKIQVPQHAGEARQQGGSQNARHDVHKHVGQGLDNPLERVHFLVRYSLQVSQTHALHVVVACYDLIHIVDKTRPEDDLHLVPGHENALGQVHVLHGLQIGQVVVLQYDSQPGGAVGDTLDVVLSSRQLRQFFRDFLISLPLGCVHDGPSLYFFPI